MQISNTKYDNEFVIKYVPVVRSIAAQMYKNNSNPILDKEDYEQCGMIGLLDALDKFDNSMDTQFLTYATKRIRGAILDGVRQCDIRKRTMAEKQKKYREIEEAAVRSFGPDISRADLIQISGLSENNFLELERAVNIQSPVSFEELTYPDGASNFDIMDNNPTYNGEYVVLQQDLQNIIQNGLTKLTEKERTVLILIYYKDFTITEVSKYLKVSQSRASQLHSKAIRKLGVLLENCLQDYAGG